MVPGTANPAIFRGCAIQAVKSCPKAATAEFLHARFFFFFLWCFFIRFSCRFWMMIVWGLVSGQLGFSCCGWFQVLREHSGGEQIGCCLGVVEYTSRASLPPGRPRRKECLPSGIPSHHHSITTTLPRSIPSRLIAWVFVIQYRLSALALPTLGLSRKRSNCTVW